MPLSELPMLKQQEVPLDHQDSCNMFRPGPNKPFVATRAAIDLYSNEVIVACWRILVHKAEEHNGLDYLQVFESHDQDENLWFIEDVLEVPSLRCSPATTDWEKRTKIDHRIDLTGLLFPLLESRARYGHQPAHP